MPIIFNSVVRPAWAIPLDEIQRMQDSYVSILEDQARKVLDTDQLIIRALKPTDLNESNSVWAQTVSATAGSGTLYEASQISGQSIPDDTVVALTGLYDISDPQMVTGLRIQSGQAVRAEWDLFPIIGSDPNRPEYRTMYTEDPIIITKTINVEIQYYIRAMAPQLVSGVEIVILGLVAEKRGKQIEP